MTNSTLKKTIAAISMAASVLAVNVQTANALSPFTPPGVGLTDCVIPGGCGPKLPGGGGIIMPPPPPGPGGGGGGGGGGGFGGGLGAGIGLGIGLGIVNSLNRPRTVIVQPAPTYVQPVQQGLSPHDQYCLRKYRSYNVGTKRYLAFSGVYKFCRSPFM